MRLSLRRQLRIMQAYAAISCGVVAFLGVTAFTQSPKFLDSEGKPVQRLPASK